MSQRIVIVGGVAAGATAAARLRRLSEDAEITIVERGRYVSFANCGLPYFLSGTIRKRSALLLQSAEGFWSRYRVRVRLETEALAIDRTERRLRVRGPEGEEWIAYDRLILAQGGQPLRLPVSGANAAHVFTLWTVPDMDAIHAYLNSVQPSTAVVVGGGFIGLEMAEAFHARGLKTTVVEAAPQLMTTLDPEFANLVAEELQAHGVAIAIGSPLAAIEPDRVVLQNGTAYPAQLLLMAAGVRPELTLAKAAGLAIGQSGALMVNQWLQTSDPAIYAAGDLIEVEHRVSGQRLRLPLAGPANRQGRIVAANALGRQELYRGALGTSVVKVMSATVASTGLNEGSARAQGFKIGTAMIHKDHHAAYYPDATPISLKIVYDRTTRRLLGATAFGQNGVDKRIDVLAMALHLGATVDGLAEVDLAYAPPYSSAHDPVNLIGFVAQNDLSGQSTLIEADSLAERLEDSAPLTLVDVRNRSEFERGALPGAINIPVDELRDRLAELPSTQPVVVYCQVGYRGHLASRILVNHGFPDVLNLSGGYRSYQLRIGGSL